MVEGRTEEKGWMRKERGSGGRRDRAIAGD